MNEQLDQLMQRGLESVTCGPIDPRYEQVMKGTHHAVVNGKTLCGRWPRKTRTMLWFNQESIRSEEHAECVTCKRCRKAMNLSPGRGDSQTSL